MPTPPSRGEVEALWQAVARGDVTRESVSAWVEPFMFATYEDKPDLLVMQALQHLHGFDMTHRSPDGNLTRKARTRHPLHAGRYRHRPPMPGNQTNVLPNVHITPNVRVVHHRQMPSDATVHNTWRLPREESNASGHER